MPQIEGRMNSEDLLDPVKMSGMEARAKSGDVDAMRAIAHHYDFVVSDSEKAIPWLEMAVEHGDASAMRGLAIHLAVKGGDANCRRAEELLKQAIREAKDSSVEMKARMSYKHMLEGNGAGNCGAKEGLNNSPVPGDNSARGWG